MIHKTFARLETIADFEITEVVADFKRINISTTYNKESVSRVFSLGRIIRETFEYKALATEFYSKTKNTLWQHSAISRDFARKETVKVFSQNVRCGNWSPGKYPSPSTG